MHIKPKLIYAIKRGITNAFQEYGVFTNDDDDFIVDLDSIPLSIVKQQYFRFFKDMPISLYETYLIESDTNHQTTSAKDVVEIMANKYHLDDWQCMACVAHTNIEVVLIVPNVPEKTNAIISEMERHGYFVGGRQTKMYYNMNWLQLQFEPRDLEDITAELETDGVQYHVTQEFNEQSIK